MSKDNTSACDSGLVEIKIPNSKYSFRYPKERPWEYEVYRYDENVTDKFNYRYNNMILDIILCLENCKYREEPVDVDSKGSLVHNFKDMIDQE